MRLIIIFTTSVCLFCSSLLHGQSIRKNYQEMTQSEKDVFVNTMHQIRAGSNNLIDTLAEFHRENFNIIHFNLPGSPSEDVFLAWHRRQILELEHAMQLINSSISVPYWDWTTDNSVNSTLWDYNFLGQFDNAWSLNRNLGATGSLPTNADVINTQAPTNWLTYSNNLEQGVVHSGPHNWVGGVMATRSSPGDPVFYLHHSMVDKLWQEWIEMNNISTSSNIYQKTSLPRYNTVNPDDIVDSGSLGVFYAENQLAELDNYTVSNTYQSVENFYYQYTIVAENGFVIPNGKTARLESVNEVIMKTGFHAQPGSEFTASLDTDGSITTSARPSGDVISIVREPIPGVDFSENPFDLNQRTQKMTFSLFPNPARDKVAVVLSDECSDCMIRIVNLNGGTELSQELSGAAQVDLSSLVPGIYIVRLRTSTGVVAVRKMVKLK